MRGPAEQIGFLNDLIVARHAELARLADTLARESQSRGRLAKGLKVALIVLGAFSASQAVAVEIAGAFSVVASSIFALVGITIAAIAGLETAFKFEARSSELRMLSARCRSARLQHNSEWAYRIAIAEPEEAVAAARDLLALQDETLSDVQLEAASLGVSVDHRGRDDEPYSEPEVDHDSALDPPIRWEPSDEEELFSPPVRRRDEG